MENKNKTEKNIILYVAKKPTDTMAKIRNELRKELGKNTKLAILYEKREESKTSPELLTKFDIQIPCNLESRKNIIKSLLPYENKILAITTRGERNIPVLQEIIPHVPYLRAPSVKSLEWSIDKVQMRRHFNAYDKKITPKYSVIHDAKKETIKKIESKIGYPMVLKPSGLAASLLVTKAYHREELEKNLKTAFRKLNKVYKEADGRGEPTMLVEQFMDGDMYSIDAYITSRGKIYFCPIVKVTTGKNVGFDDFFGFKRSLPTRLKSLSVKQAEDIASKGLKALRLRSTTAHIELMRTEDGWKLIEIGPRIGGYRDNMYRNVFNIPHTLNDILIRIPKKPILPKRINGYTNVYNFYAKKEGKIQSIKGLINLQQLKSMKSFKQNKKVGDKAIFAKHGGKPVLEVTLFNKNKVQLLADSRKLEKMIQIKI